MSNPISPNYRRGVGQLVTTRYDFQEHVDGYSFKHNSKYITLSPTINIGSVDRTTVYDALVALNNIVATPFILPQATSSVLGGIKLLGDISGIATNIKVNGIQNFAISSLTPTNNQVLTWDGNINAWKPANISNAIIFDGVTNPSNIRANRPIYQSPITNTFVGIVNLSSDTSTVSSGATNNYVTICGGNMNKSAGDGAAIVGGTNNTADGYASFIGGGQSNIASGTYSSISGGLSNTATGSYSFIGGGITNTANGTRSFIGSGQSNTATGNYSSISGGFANATNGSLSFIGGGSSNIAAGLYSAIGGGNVIITNGSRSFIGSGSTNTTNGSYSFIGSGQSNIATGTHSSISGGLSNTTNGNYSAIGSGQSNTATGNYSSISGGINNAANGDNSFIGGGNTNTATGVNSVIGGGYANATNGSHSFIGGGGNSITEIEGEYSFAEGWSARTNKFGQKSHSSSAFASVPGSSQFSRVVYNCTSSFGAEAVFKGEVGDPGYILEGERQYAFRITVVANQAGGGSGVGAFWIYDLLVSTNSTPTGAILSTNLAHSYNILYAGPAFTINPNNFLRIAFTGHIGYEVRAVATIEATEVLFNI